MGSRNKFEPIHKGYVVHNLGSVVIKFDRRTRRFIGRIYWASSYITAGITSNSPFLHLSSSTSDSICFLALSAIENSMFMYTPNDARALMRSAAI